jgi:hypothetical protein
VDKYVADKICYFATFVIFEKLPKEKNRPMGENNSPDLATRVTRWGFEKLPQMYIAQAIFRQSKCITLTTKK